MPILLTAATTFSYIAGLLVSRTGPAPEGRRGLCRADRGQLAFPFSLLLHLRGLAPPRWEVSLPLPHPAVFSSPHPPTPNPGGWGLLLGAAADFLFQELLLWFLHPDFYSLRLWSIPLLDLGPGTPTA